MITNVLGRNNGRDELMHFIADVLNLQKSSGLELEVAIKEVCRGHMEYGEPTAETVLKIDEARKEAAGTTMKFFDDNGYSRYFEGVSSGSFDGNKIQGAIYLNIPDVDRRIELYQKLLREYSLMGKNQPFNFKFITRDGSQADYRRDNFVIYVQEGCLADVCGVLKCVISDDLLSSLEAPARSLSSIDDLFTYQPRGAQSYSSEFARIVKSAIESADSLVRPGRPDIDFGSERFAQYVDYVRDHLRGRIDEYPKMPDEISEMQALLTTRMSRINVSRENDYTDGM